jgi:hypothetical protein
MLEYLPAGHNVHTASPVCGLKLPGAHAEKRDLLELKKRFIEGISCLRFEAARSTRRKKRPVRIKKEIY